MKRLRTPSYVPTLVVAVAAILAAMSFVLSGPISAGASPTVLYVARSGHNSGNCSASASPCATITYALKHDGGGGVTIDVSGTIADNVSITSATAPDADPVTIRQAPGAARAVVNGKAKGPVFTMGQASVSLIGLTIENGSAVDGGGIYAAAQDRITIDRSTITRNTATYSAYQGEAEGGGIWAYNSGITIDDSTISNNSAVADDNGWAQGGGIYSWNTNLFVTNSTVANNHANGTNEAWGGGIELDHGGEAVISSSTISDNVLVGPTVDGAAIMDEVYDGVLFVELAGDLLASAGGPPAGGECAFGGFIDEGYNIDDDGSCGLNGSGSISDSSTIDGSLASLTKNGGPTETILPSRVSPAARVIPPNTTVDGISLCSGADQRGKRFPRPAPGASTCSIGAVEADVGR
jgi:hypothetical protein